MIYYIEYMLFHLFYLYEFYILYVNKNYNTHFIPDIWWNPIPYISNF